MAFVKNAWYPAGWASEIGRTLQRRTILAENIVVYRREDHGLVALEDRCPHRLTPLSMGKLKGDAIECGYHGMTFDGSGQCVRIPGQTTIPTSAKVRSYPAAERMGLVWIWMGDADRADPADIYDLPQFHDPAWAAVQGDALHIRAHYLSLADNLTDPSHVSFVHLSTLGNASSEDVPVQQEKRDNAIIVWRWILDGPPIPIFAKYGHFAGNVDRWHYYHYEAPCIAIIDFGSAAAGAIDPAGGDRSRGLQIYACHFITPVDDNHCIDHWLHVRNFSQDDRAVDEKLNTDFRAAFAEDKEILESIRREEERDPGFRPLRLAIDAAPVRMRRMVERMAESAP